MGKQWKHWDTLFSWALKSLQVVMYSYEIKTQLLLGKKAMTNLDSTLKSRDITLSTKVCLINLVVTCRCESWTIKKAECQRINDFELWCWKRPVHPKENQSWAFIGRIDVEAESPILWPRDEKNWLIGKDPDAGKHWRLEEKGTTEDKMIG